MSFFRECSKVIKHLDIHLESETFYFTMSKCPKCLTNLSEQFLKITKKNTHIKSSFCAFQRLEKTHKLIISVFFLSRGFMK